MIRSIVITLLLTSAAVFAADTPASEVSIREILQVTEAKKMVDGMMPQVEAMMKTSMQQALNGRQISADQQAAIEKMQTKMMAMLRDELSWDRMEPLYLSVYRKSFTQEEVDGMLAFYKSPAGKALVRKMPTVLQETMVAMQGRMGPMLQKIQAAIEETAAEIGAKKD